MLWWWNLYGIPIDSFCDTVKFWTLLNMTNRNKMQVHTHAWVPGSSRLQYWLRVWVYDFITSSSNQNTVMTIVVHELVTLFPWAVKRTAVTRWRSCCIRERERETTFMLHSNACVLAVVTTLHASEPHMTGAWELCVAVVFRVKWLFSSCSSYTDHKKIGRLNSNRL